MRGVRSVSFLASRLFLKDWLMKKIAQMFSWDFIVISYILFITLFLLSGCASHISATVGDHTVRSGFHLQYEADEHD